MEQNRYKLAALKFMLHRLYRYCHKTDKSEFKQEVYCRYTGKLEGFLYALRVDNIIEDDFIDAPELIAQPTFNASWEFLRNSIGINIDAVKEQPK